jgi:hypothetical protein
MNEHDQALEVICDILPVAEINPGKTYSQATAARFYVNRVGWSIFPIHHPVEKAGAHHLSCSCGRDCSSPAKHPLCVQGFLDATRDLRQVEHWWSEWPRANIGLPTGTVEQGGIGFDVIDVDGPKGAESWEKIKHKLPPYSYVAFTPGNRKRPAGRHYYIPAQGSQGRNGILPGIDLKADGGYVLAPPSRGILGPHYAWVVAPDVT